VRNRTGHDPDEIIRQNGAEALHELSEKKLSWMEFVIEYYKSRMNLDSYLEKREFVEKVGAEIQRLKDPEEQRYFSNELNKLTGMQVHVEITPKPQEMSAPAGQARAPIGAEAAEKQILGLMMKSAEAIEDYKKELGFLNDSLHQKLALMILDKARERGEVDPVMLLDMTEDQQIRNLITDLINPDSYESLTYSSSLFHGLMCRVQYETAKKQADAIKEQLGLALNDDGRAILLNRYLECLNEMRRLIDDEHGKYE
jgi:DNA primase